MNEFYAMDVDRITADVNQPRKHFDNAAIAELAESIKTYGLLQPLIVRPNDPKLPVLDAQQTYTIIAGERRYRASVLAGLKRVSVKIRESDDYKEIALIENLQRKDLNKVEEAEAIRDLMEAKSYTHDQVAQVLSKSRPYVSNALRLLNLTKEEQRALLDEKISDAHARVLVGIREEKERMRLLHKILNDKMSVREAERYSKNLKKRQDIFIKQALEQLEDLLDNKVYTRGRTKSKGTLCIEYNSEDELEQVIEALLSGACKS